MEKDNKNISKDQDDSKKGENFSNKKEGSEETSHLGAIDHDVSGNDISEQGKAERSHHQQFGNRKYESYKNHSSADDQPMNDAGPGL